MGMEERTQFQVDLSRCMGCGRCVNVCSGLVLEMAGGHSELHSEMHSEMHPEMKPFERFGWHGCWRCQHCLAVCPTGAIQIFHRRPEDSLPLPPKEMGPYMEQLVASRRSCRRFLDRDVDAQLLTRILSVMADAPTGGNTQGVEYTVIDDRARVREIREIAYGDMEACAARHVFTHSFNAYNYSVMKASEKTVRHGDLLFCGAPHLFIAHAPLTGRWAEDTKADCILATAYFELLCNAHGLGTTIMSYASEVLNELAPKARDMLNIPRDHYTGLIVGFGYPEIPYARGVQKDRRARTHRYSEDRQKGGRVR